MTVDDIRNDYYEWLVSKIEDGRHFEPYTFNKLLMRLHGIEFVWSVPMDSNRAANGRNLRWRYSLAKVPPELRSAVLADLDGPCSVLEMMVALAIHCEEDIMDDPKYGNRTAQWFWGMIGNLGLGTMTDDRFDKHRVDIAIERLLKREYLPNGKGGLFTVKNSPRDMRDIEILWQLHYYLNSIS